MAPDDRRWQRAVQAASVVVLLVLTAFQVLPEPGTLSSKVAPNTGDPLIVTWIMEHQASALLSDPATLYNGNIFYPEPAAIAWTDNLTAFVPAYLLVWVATGRDSILAYNVVTWLAFACGSIAVLALARRLLRSPLAGLIVAVAFSLAMVRHSAIGHTQLAGFLFLPLALVLLMDLVEARRVRTAILAGMCLAGLWYTAVYFFVLAVVVVPTLALVWALGNRQAIDRRLVGLTAGVALTTALLVAPSVAPYLDLQRRASFQRSDAELITIGPDSFTQPGSVVYRWLDQVDPTGEGNDGFVGWTVLGLAALAVGGAVVARGRREPDASGGEPPDRWTPEQRRRQFALPLAVAFTLAGLISLGPDGPFSVAYQLLRPVVPGLDSARALNRFWVLPALGLALLAGRGFERLTARLPRRTAPAAAALVVALLVLELFIRPGTARVANDPDLVAVNEVLTSLPGGVVTELPVPTLPGYPYILSVRQLRSLEDGLPRVEGYSGDAPAGLPEYFQAVSAFPADHAIEALRQAGVRHVVLHGAEEACASRFGPDELDDLLARAVASPAVEGITRVGAEAVVTLTPAPRRGPLREIPPVRPPARTTTPCDRD